MKRDLTLVLAGILLLSTMTSCRAEETESTDTTAPETKVSETTEETVDLADMTYLEQLSYDRALLTDALPEKDYAGYTFRVGYLYLDDETPASQFYQDWQAEEMTGEVLNDAVYQRNITVEERFHVDVVMVRNHASSYYDEISAAVLAEEDLCDMISIHPGFFGRLTLDGFMQNLAEMEYLDFAQPWWMQTAIENLSYDGKIYTAHGTANAVSLLGDCAVMFFNKDMAEDLQIEDLYTVVRENRWTLDYALKLISTTASDTDGDGIMGENDRYGLYFSFPNVMNRFVWSLGGRYVTNIDGIPTITMNNSAMEKAYSGAWTLYEADGTYAYPDYGQDSFTNGNSLLYYSAVCNYSSFRELDFAVGILPNFKADEEQEKYLTFGSGCPQGILITVQDTERSAIIMEALNAEGYRLVVPAYYESAVKLKMVPDQESAEMLDIAMNGVVFDGCQLFYNDATFMLNDFINGSSGFASFMQSRIKLAENYMNANIGKLNALDH